MLTFSGHRSDVPAHNSLFLSKEEPAVQDRRYSTAAPRTHQGQVPGPRNTPPIVMGPHLARPQFFRSPEPGSSKQPDQPASPSGPGGDSGNWKL